MSSQWYIANMFTTSRKLHQQLLNYIHPSLSCIASCTHFQKLVTIVCSGQSIDGLFRQLSLYNFTLHLLYNTWAGSQSYDSNFQMTIKKQESLSIAAGLLSCSNKT